MKDEKASRAYIEQMWAEAMVIYQSKQYQLSLSKEMEQYLKEFQKQFMPEGYKSRDDTGIFGWIQWKYGLLQNAL